MNDHATTREELETAYEFEQLYPIEVSETQEWVACKVDSEALWLN